MRTKTRIETNTSTAISPEMLKLISQRLGRKPRGLEDIAVYSDACEPVVIRVASLVEGKPFPNLFWLIDPDLVYKIDCDEAGGLIARMQERVDVDMELQSDMTSDHRAYIDLRNSHMSSSVEAELRASNYYEVLQRRGIGGIADFSRIRCLHTWYAAHLVVPNTIGRLLDQHWAEKADPLVPG